VLTDIVTKVYGYDPPCQEDVSILHASVPHVRLIEPKPMANGTQVCIRSLVKKHLRAPAGEIPLAENGAFVKAVATHVRFLVALSISTSAIVVWQQIDSLPFSAVATRLPSGEPLGIEFAAQSDIKSSAGPLHAGHLRLRWNSLAGSMCGGGRIGSWRRTKKVKRFSCVPQGRLLRSETKRISASSDVWSMPSSQKCWGSVAQLTSAGLVMH
jgi:hypothetical protein